MSKFSKSLSECAFHAIECVDLVAGSARDCYSGDIQHALQDMMSNPTLLEHPAFIESMKNIGQQIVMLRLSGADIRIIVPDQPPEGWVTAPR